MVVKHAWSTVDRDLKALRDRISRRNTDFHSIALAANYESLDGKVNTILTVLEDKKQTSLTTGECKLIPYTQNMNFFPRPGITAKIEAQLNSNSTSGPRSVLIYGLGGSGKTQLVLNFVYTRIKEYDVILWIGADTEQTLAEGFLSACKKLGVAHDKSPESVASALHQWLEKTSKRIMSFVTLLTLLVSTWNFTHPIFRTQMASHIRQRR